jgi:hypothetical protein
MTRLSAYTTQLQPHLPPIDTVNAIVKLSNGVSGTISLSFGTTSSGPAEWVVLCKDGTVSVASDTATVTKGDGEEKGETKEFTVDTNGIASELKAWGEGIAKGKVDALQTPEEALADLEVVSFFSFFSFFFLFSFLFFLFSFFFFLFSFFFFLFSFFFFVFCFFFFLFSFFFFLFSFFFFLFSFFFSFFLSFFLSFFFFFFFFFC